MVNFLTIFGPRTCSLWLQPEAIPYILSKLTTELYPGILSLTHTVRQQNMAYLFLLIRTSICIDVLTGCMPPKLLEKK